MIIREKYLSKIRPYYDSEQIKALIGVRRAGKSTLMNQIISELKEIIPENRIFYVDFEDFDSEIYLSDPHGFYNIVKSFCAGKERCYIFLDEIQHLEKFEMVIASMRSKLGASVFVTGSNSHLLSGQLATKLTGRVIEFRILPFSYDEVSAFLKREDEETFLDYLRNGGMPIRFNEHNLLGFSPSLYKSIINRDLVETYKIMNPAQLHKFASYILASSGEVVSADSIVKTMNANNDAFSIATAYKYLSYLEEAFLVSSCNRFDIKGKQILTSLKKYYAVDSSFIYAQKGNKSINEGFVLETIVYNELISRGYEVYTGKTYKGEVDFVVLSEGNRCYVQVCYLLASDEIIKREFDAFKSIKDNHPKYVISMDKIDMSQDGIIHLNIRDFLIHKSEIIFL